MIACKHGLTLHSRVRLFGEGSRCSKCDPAAERSSGYFVGVTNHCSDNKETGNSVIHTVVTCCSLSSFINNVPLHLTHGSQSDNHKVQR